MGTVVRTFLLSVVSISQWETKDSGVYPRNGSFSALDCMSIKLIF